MMKTMWCRGVLLLAAAGDMVATLANDAETRPFALVAQKTQRPEGAPPLNAVCFSSRSKHPANAKDPHDTFRTAEGFHATGFYWVYAAGDKAWIAEVKKRGYTFQGALNTILPDRLGAHTSRQGRLQNEQGALLTAPWMSTWKGVWWGCVNSAEYRQTYLEHAKAYLDAGVDTLQMDDPDANVHGRQWGACYCKYCREKAAQLGKKPPEIQQESVARFYTDMRTAINAYAGRRVPFSCNNYNGSTNFPAALFDFGIAELPEKQANPLNIYRTLHQAATRGWAQLFTLVSTNCTITRQAIALTYAAGGHLIVPWDVYIGNSPRYFGTPAQYADLYGFVRANAKYFAGYEDAAVVLPKYVDNRYSTKPLGISGGSGKVAVFVRAVPGDRQAPVVIHCVEGDSTPQAFKLTYDTARFFGDTPVAIDLLTPAPYAEQAHQAAERTNNFAALTTQKRLATGHLTSIDVPALTPWGLLVIAPDVAQIQRK